MIHLIQRIQTDSLYVFVLSSLLIAMLQREKGRFTCEMENQGWSSLDWVQRFSEPVSGEACEGQEHCNGNVSFSAGKLRHAYLIKLCKKHVFCK